jgi:methionine-rich copper-binding protein CopC
MPHGGAQSLRSGVIGDSAQSRVGFSITLLNEASLSFWMRTSTETCCDFGALYVDGVVRASRAGTTAWTQYETSLTAGVHSIEFRYSKDGSFVSGSDAVWIDDIVIGPPSDPSTGFETATLPAGYASSGSALWTTVTTMPHGGSRCAQSGSIGDSETSSMSRTVTLASAQTLTFWIRTSTESGFDYLRTFVDGTMRDQWSGTTAWTLVSYPLTAGAHTIEWRYVKDLSLSSGSDAVWVDDVSFGPPPSGGPLCGP